MSTNAARLHLSDEERAGRAALRRSWDALPRASAHTGPKAKAREIVAAAIANMAPETLARPPTGSETWLVAEMCLALSIDGDDGLFDCIEKLRAQVANLEGDAKVLRDEIGDLRHELAAVRKARGHSDGRELPASAVPPVRRRAALKRKPNGATPGEARP
jgi:hypothetical protein